MTGTDLKSVKIVQATLDIDPGGRGIVILGIIDPMTLRNLKADQYQREELSDVKIAALMDALREGRVPTIELGMRGDDTQVRTVGDICYLQAPTYIVDGLQRVTAAMRLMGSEPDNMPRLSVVVHLNTTFEWELERFKALNIGQTKLSGNVNLRNLQWHIEVMKVLMNLTGRKDFVLGGRVCWDQSMKRGHLVTGTTFSRVVGMLHGHIGPGRSTAGEDLARGLQKIYDNTGRNTFLQNIRLFFDIVNKCWGIESVAYRNNANQLKLSFLLALARMFSDHTNFWQDAKFVVDEQTIRKLATFPMQDPSIVTLAGAGGGKASELLAIMLADHVNLGRRSRRLTRRVNDVDIDLEEGEA